MQARSGKPINQAIISRHLILQRGPFDNLKNVQRYTRHYISALERCRYGASIDVVDRLAKELAIEAADLLQHSRIGPDVGAEAPTSEEGD